MKKAIEQGSIKRPGDDDSDSSSSSEEVKPASHKAPSGTKGPQPSGETHKPQPSGATKGPKPAHNGTKGSDASGEKHKPQPSGATKGTKSVPAGTTRNAGKLIEKSRTNCCICLGIDESNIIEVIFL